MLIRDLEQTCTACPSQWEARTEGDRPVYVRYRSGYLSVRVGEPGGDAWAAVRGLELYGEQIGGDDDGEIAWPDVARRIAALDLDQALAAARREDAGRRAAREAEWAREDALLASDPAADDSGEPPRRGD